MINPVSDPAFATAANGALDTSWTSEALADALRAQYPAVIVRPRELSGETLIVWYVYRDGHWVGS